jgi:hypothetical protein
MSNNGVLNDQDSNMLANAINHYHSIQHQEQLSLLISEQEYFFVKTYNLIPFKSGDSWCVLLGKDLQSGIVGFGETPHKAVLAFNKAYYSK